MLIPTPMFGVALATLVSATSAPLGDVESLSHARLSEALAAVASEHPDVASLHRVGVSREGRAIEALRLTGTEDPSNHPALLLVANLEGPRVFESGVVLDHARRLANAYESDESVRALLDTTVVWFVPRANPDAAEGRFASPSIERWASSIDVDNDRDGRRGEDGPADVNGDGVVTTMRVLDPEGEWMEDPTDARVLIQADRVKGERGKWRLYPESRDLDGDETFGEDAPRDAQVDRNFASGWEEHVARAGTFPTDEPEARALCEFVMAQKNLALVVVYDGHDNLVEKPKSVADDAAPVKRVPPYGVLESDAELLEEIGREYREQTKNEAKGDGEDAGTFARWCYDHRGLVTLSAVLWNLPDEAPAADEDADAAEGDDGAVTEEAAADEAAPAEEEDDEVSESDAKPSDDAKHLLWIDGAGESWRFVDWTPFDHPELGSVEIGGFAPFARSEPPQDAWTKIADAHFDWFQGLGELLPRIELVECEREKLGTGVWKVTATLTNDAYLPLLSRSMQRTRTTRPAKVSLVLPDGATLLSGNTQELVRDLAGSGGRAEFEWLVHGPDGMELGVSVDSDHAGRAFRKAEVSQ